MFALSRVFLVVASFQVICSQGLPPQGPPGAPQIPPQCRGPPPNTKVRPHECCKIPPFFSEKDFEECGFKQLDASEGPQQGPPACTKQLCMLNKYSLAKDDTIDYAAVSAYMDKYAETNEAFKPSVTLAKQRCLGGNLPGPPQICEANKMVFCIGSTLFTECPAWEDNEDCQALKNHMEQCKPYFNP